MLSGVYAKFRAVVGSVQETFAVSREKPTTDSSSNPAHINLAINALANSVEMSDTQILAMAQK